MLLEAFALFDQTAQMPYAARDAIPPPGAPATEHRRCQGRAGEEQEGTDTGLWAWDRNHPEEGHSAQHSQHQRQHVTTTTSTTSPSGEERRHLQFSSQHGAGRMQLADISRWEADEVSLLARAQPVASASMHRGGEPRCTGRSDRHAQRKRGSRRSGAAKDPCGGGRAACDRSSHIVVSGSSRWQMPECREPLSGGGDPKAAARFPEGDFASGGGVGSCGVVPSPVPRGSMLESVPS
jgi:hypothetical protein